MKILKLLLFSAVISCIPVVFFYFAEPCTAAPTFMVPAKEPASQSYDEATKLLDSGKDTYKAIALLKHSISAAPNIPTYHEALAFAYTDKAAFVYRALIFRDGINMFRSTYLSDLHKWKLGRLDKNSLSYTSPPPEDQPLHVIHLKDDGSIFTESDQQATNDINDLFSSSEAQWIPALSLAKTDCDKARLRYERASIDCIFAVIKDNITPVQKGPVIASGLHAYQESAREIAAATRLQPQNGLYWEAAGTIADELESEARYTNGSFSKDAPYPPSHAYYMKSLALQPDNEALWLKLAKEDRQDDKAVLYDVSQAYRLNPKNECVLLSYINALYKTTHYNTGGFNDPSTGDKWKTLLASLDSSDASTVKAVEHLLVETPTPVMYAPAIYDYPYPAPLILSAKELTISPEPNVDEMVLRNAARCVAGTAKCLAMQGKWDEGVALLNGLTKGVATMLTPDHFTPDAVATGKPISALFGDAIMGIAMTEQAKIADDYESKSQAAIADEALAEFHAASAARKREELVLTSTLNDMYVYY
jgi:hypothetical protein